MPDHTTPAPASILPPDIEAARQQILAATKEVFETWLGRPLSQEAHNYLVALVMQASAAMHHFSSNPPIAWTTLEFPADQADPDA